MSRADRPADPIEKRRLIHELGDAIVADDPSRIRLLLTAGAARNGRPWNGPYTAVFVAVRLRRYRSLETLLKAGATTTRQRTDHDPLEEALRKADTKALELLLRYSAKTRRIQRRRHDLRKYQGIDSPKPTFRALWSNVGRR